MYGLKALYSLLALNYSSYNYTVIAKPEIATQFPTNPNANFINEADSSHRRLVQSSYSQVGSTFYGDNTNHMIGYNGVVISDNGLIIAFSSYYYIDVDIYEYNGSSWVRKGSRITYDVGGFYFGWSLDLSSDGLTVAVGAHYYSGTNTNQGAIYIYNFDGSDWLLHTEITGGGVNYQIGYSLALSGDGATLLYSSKIDFDVAVLRLNNNVWSHIGLISTSTNVWFGRGLAINYDGSIIAVSANTYVKVYQYQTSQWVQQGSTISTTDTGAKFRINLNDVGNLLVVNSYGGFLNAYQYVNDDWGSMYTDDDITITDSSVSGLGSCTKITNDGSLVLLGTTSNTVLVFAMTTCGWYKVQEIYLNESNFGMTFDVTGDGARLIVSAYGSNSSQGSIYVYDISPVIACPMPSELPSNIPSYIPSMSQLPSSIPSYTPTDLPSLVPSKSPSPSMIPSLSPSVLPTYVPSLQPTYYPSNLPSIEPSSIPSKIPSQIPSKYPTRFPSCFPSNIPTQLPSNFPSNYPTKLPSVVPSDLPTQLPSDIPSNIPTQSPSVVSSDLPSQIPSNYPTHVPSAFPSNYPTQLPSVENTPLISIPPSNYESTYPSISPSFLLSDAYSNVPTTASSLVMSQYESLIALYHATGGASWVDNNWLDNNVAVCDFDGVTCNKDTGIIEGLVLNNFSLTGTFPPELLNFKSLQTLVFSNNLLTGSLPPYLNEVPNLSSIDLSGNRFTGPIPTTLTQIDGLASVDVSSNYLTGMVPSELGLMVAVSSINLSGNLFNGLLPTELSALTNLRSLQINNVIDRKTDNNLVIVRRLANDGLLGTIMTEIGLLGNLEVLDLSGNRFTGSLPTELGGLVNLEHIDISYNAFTGSLPSELGNLVTLRHLNLSSNMFTGSMPKEVLSIGNLEYLNIANNAITGSIPDAMCSLGEVFADCVFIKCACCVCSSWSPSKLPSIVPSREDMSRVPIRLQSRSPSVSSSFLPSSITTIYQRPVSSYFPSLSMRLQSRSPSVSSSFVSPSVTSRYNSPSLSPSLSTMDLSMSQSATVSLQIDGCLNRDLYNHERNEMEGILLDFVQQMLHDQNVQVLNITIDSQSLVRLLPEEYYSRRELQLVSRRLDIHSFALCAESIDFQSSFEGSFKNVDRNIELLQTLKSSNILNVYFENVSLIAFMKMFNLEYEPSSSPSMNKASAIPVNDGTNAGTIGAAALAGVGAAAAAASASASSAGAAASASVGGGSSGGAGGERKINLSRSDVREVAPDQHTNGNEVETGKGQREDGAAQQNNISLNDDNVEKSSEHHGSEAITLSSHSEDSESRVGAAGAVGSAGASSAGTVSSSSGGRGSGGGAGGEKMVNVSGNDVNELSSDHLRFEEGVATTNGQKEDVFVEKNNNNSLGNDTVEISSERHASKETTLSTQSQDTEAVNNQEKDNQTTNTGKDKLSKTGDALTIAEGGLEKKVGRLNVRPMLRNRVKGRLSKKEKQEIPANVVVAAFVLRAVIRLERRIETETLLICT